MLPKTAPKQRADAHLGHGTFVVQNLQHKMRQIHGTYLFWPLLASAADSHQKQVSSQEKSRAPWSSTSKSSRMYRGCAVHAGGRRGTLGSLYLHLRASRMRELRGRSTRVFREHRVLLDSTPSTQNAPQSTRRAVAGCRRQRRTYEAAVIVDLRGQARRDEKGDRVVRAAMTGARIPIGAVAYSSSSVCKRERARRETGPGGGGRNESR